jgi:uncharacterized protein (DUF362 family)
MSKVALVETTPDTVTADYGRLMTLVDYTKVLPKDVKTIIKINLSWTLYYPACSTEPWQLDGTLKQLKKDGYTDVLGVENQTVVTHPWKGAYNNKWLPILDKYNVDYQPLTDVKWTKYEPKTDILVMNELFGEILIPEIFIKNNILHLPTVKTHGHTTTTGALKNAFGGLIPKYRHHAHKKIHEVLVDLLSIQKEIHTGLFAVMDGSVCGDGAGPRVMEPYPGNVILASADQVAIDAVAAKLMGFDPLKIEYIKLAHDKGLGMGDVDQIEIVGTDRSEFEKTNFGFETKRSLIIRWDQRLRKSTAKKSRLHNFLFHSPMFKSFIFASEFYHDWFWYPLIGKRKIKRFSETGWGKLFNKYEYGKFPEYTEVKDWDPY